MSAIVRTRQGNLEGIESNGLHIFKGVPYAAPPVGARRWLPPAPPESWSGVRKATAFSPVAPQNPVPVDLAFLKLDEPQSEDCLYLNVWTPGLDDARRPVMVWIHGGGFTIGAGSQLLSPMDSALARRGDVVKVSINYRLGPLGFLNLREVTGGRIPATGNEGLLDQIAALEWVRDNIRAFGGDPGNVTIFGESAGGMSVGTLLAMPKARGLFHRAIPQSGASHTSNTLPRAVRVAERFLGLLGTRDPERLRALPVSELLAAQPRLNPGPAGTSDPEIGGMPLQPVVDGMTLPTVAIDAVRGGSASGVSLLVGTTEEEWKLFSIMDPTLQGLDEAGLGPRCEARLPGGARIAEAYRAARAARGADTKPAEILSAFETDRVFRIQALRLLDAQRSHEPRVYSYLVTWRSPFLGGAVGACHAIELGPLFGLHDAVPTSAEFFGKGPEADSFARAMQEAWTAFARTGDPSCTMLGRWPAYEPGRRATMLLGGKSELAHDPLGAERAAWDGVPDSAIGVL